MSTTPGDSTWADTGLVPPQESEVQDPSRTTVPVEVEHQPAAPRPDLRDEANESDVLEDVDHRPDPARPDLRGEASESDVVEQAQEVPELADDDYDGE